MGTYRKGFLHHLPTLVTPLRGEAGVHSNDLMSSTCSLGSEDVEEGAPSSVEDGFGQMIVLNHIEDTQVLNGDMMIVLSIVFGHFEMMVAPLAIDLQMRLGNIASGFPAALRALLAPAQLPLLASKYLLRGAIEAGVRNGIAFRVSKEDCEADIDPDIGMFTLRRAVPCLWPLLTGKQGIPMSIGPVNKIDRLRHPDQGPMQLDLEEVTELLRHNEVPLILMQIAVFPVLPQVNAMPPVGLLEAREAHIRDAQFFGGKKPFEGLGEPISKTLHSGGWYMCTTTSFEGGIQGVLARKCAILLILCLERGKHLVIEHARLGKASHEQFGLFLIGIQTILKQLHTYILMSLLEFVKRAECASRRVRFTPVAEARGPHVLFFAERRRVRWIHLSWPILALGSASML